jgi:type III restriction enzyme
MTAREQERQREQERGSGRAAIRKAIDPEHHAEVEQRVEQVDPEKVGGKIEFIFAVNKLSEGWDVDNVFQIVPAEERVFNSKLLISQVLGR